MVVRAKVDINYYLYRMDWSETAAILEEIYEQEKEQTEQTRTISYYSVLAYLKNGTTITDFMPLPWDKPEQIEPVDLEAMEKQANILCKLLSTKQDG